MLYNTYRFGFSRHLFLALAALAISTFQAPSISAHEIICSKLYHLDPTATWQGVAETPGAAAHLAVDIPSAGILVAEVALPNTNSSSPRLSVVHEPCGAESASFAIAERSASGLTLLVTEPGRIMLAAATVDPRYALGEYRALTHFVALSASSDQVDLPLGEAGVPWRQVTRVRWTGEHGQLMAQRLKLDLLRPVTKTEMEEIDPNPAGVRYHGTWLLDAAWLEATRVDSLTGRVKTEMEEIDPNPAGLWVGPRSSQKVWVTVTGSLIGAAASKTEMEEIDPNPAGLLYTPRQRQLSFPLRLSMASGVEDSAARAIDIGFVRELVDAATRRITDPSVPSVSAATRLGACVARLGDDYPDALACATAIELDERQTGTLSTDYRTDADPFSFTIDQLMTIEVRVDGDVELSAALFDHTGRRLSTTAIDDDEVRILETLEPGSYTVRVEALEPQPGSYHLVINGLEG